MPIKFMNKLLKIAIISFLLTITILTNLYGKETDSTQIAEPETQENIEIKIPDTLSFRYKFVQGDSLFYSVFSRDSIIINYDLPLLRLREEQILITCDSINKSGNYCLTQKTTYYRAVESYKENQNVETTETDWLNVPVYIEIDSLGRRIHVSNADTLTARLSPGGVFKPILFITLLDANDNYKADSSTWMNENRDTLAENAMPMPIFKNNTLFRMLGKHDTVEHSTIKFSFARVGQAAYELLTDDISLKTSAVINSGGELFLDTTLWVPLFFTHAMEQKLTFHYPNSKTQPGWHFITSDFILTRAVRPDKPVAANPPGNQSKSSKKNKK